MTNVRQAVNARRVEIRSMREFRRRVVGEHRALQADADTLGGYLVKSGEVFDQIVQIEKEVSVVRAISRVLPPAPRDSETPIPTQESALADAEWITELTVATADAVAPFGQVVLRHKPIQKRIRVSKRLLRQQPLAESWILQAIADAIATPQELAFLKGSGSGEPLGIANDPEVATVTTSVSGNITGGDVLDWLMGLGARFWPRAKVLTTPAFLRHILKLKDGDGNYLFLPYAGRLVNVPVLFSDALSSAVDSSGDLVAGEVGAVVGDFGFLWIQDADELEILRLVELYAEENEDAYQVTQWVDSSVVVPAAFRVLRIKS